jgi:hypothetical protein
VSWTPMDPDGRDLLAACFEARRRQREMLPLIATALGVPEGQVFHTWMTRRDRDLEDLPGSPWKFIFHGFECDLRNTADGRFLRYDFGPGGRCDCVTAWGVLQFVMTSKAPWQSFPRLRESLARSGQPYDYLSGDHAKVSEVWGRLEREGCFEPADPGLVAFQSRHTAIGPDGINYVSYPESTPDATAIDCAVAHRPLLTARAHVLLRENPYHPVTADPAWLTSTVVSLAKGIWDEKAYDRLPILADALQDAGCDTDDVLTHCRDPKQVHVRGCWVVDLLLGKE